MKQEVVAKSLGRVWSVHNHPHRAFGSIYETREDRRVSIAINGIIIFMGFEDAK